MNTISVSLRAWEPDTDEPLPDAAFFDRLVFAPGDGPSRTEGPGVARVQLLLLDSMDFIKASRTLPGVRRRCT
jgi:hypothetical protein